MSATPYFDFRKNNATSSGNNNWCQLSTRVYDHSYAHSCSLRCDKSSYARACVCTWTKVKSSLRKHNTTVPLDGTHPGRHRQSSFYAAIVTDLHSEYHCGNKIFGSCRKRQNKVQPNIIPRVRFCIPFIRTTCLEKFIYYFIQPLPRAQQLHVAHACMYEPNMGGWEGQCFHDEMKMRALCLKRHCPRLAVRMIQR